MLIPFIMLPLTLSCCGVQNQQNWYAGASDVLGIVKAGNKGHGHLHLKHGSLH